MANYQLTQTGAEVQAILDAVEDMANDYIVKEGVDSATGLSYRKWASGIAEVYGRISQYVSSSQWVVWGSVVYNSNYTTFDYPSNLFVDVPTSFQATSTGRVAAWICTGGNGTKDRTPILYFVRPTASGDETYYFNLYVIGKWK